jgi:sugar-phosphatase
MTEIRCNGVLFDLDGVLIDSTPAVTRVWRQWALEHGFDPKEVVARVHGRPSLATVREYLPNADHAAENREIERREMQDADGIITLPGARELLLHLPAERWTIATSCTRSLAEVRLRAASLPIPERIVTSTDVTLGKPHPEPFLKAAAKLGFPASECGGGRCSRGDPRRQGRWGESHRFPYHRRRGGATARGCRFYLE